MIGKLKSWRTALVLAILAVTVVMTTPSAERQGDNLQVTLPLLGLGCSIVTGGWVDYTLRFVALEAAIHGSKNALGKAEINRRPNGGYQGFPSGHTSAATFGASRLISECVTSSPIAQATIAVAAAFTGATRIESGWHTIWQVLGGWVLGVLVDRLFRRGRPERRAIDPALRRYVSPPLSRARARLRRALGRG